MTPTDAFFAGKRYAIFGAQARGRMHGPMLIGALGKAGKRAVAIEEGNPTIKGAEVAETLAAAGQVDGAVVLPPVPWDSEAAEFTAAAARQCKEQAVQRIWIYTAGDASRAAEIAAQHGLDPVAGRCPCLHIVGCGFPHGTHRVLAKLFRQL